MRVYIYIYSVASFLTIKSNFKAAINFVLDFFAKPRVTRALSLSLARSHADRCATILLLLAVTVLRDDDNDDSAVYP